MSKSRCSERRSPFLFESSLLQVGRRCIEARVSSGTCIYPTFSSFEVQIYSIFKKLNEKLSNKLEVGYELDPTCIPNISFVG